MVVPKQQGIHSKNLIFYLFFHFIQHLLQQQGAQLSICLQSQLQSQSLLPYKEEEEEEEERGGGVGGGGGGRERKNSSSSRDSSLHMQPPYSVTVFWFVSAGSEEKEKSEGLSRGGGAEEEELSKSCSRVSVRRRRAEAQYPSPKRYFEDTQGPGPRRSWIFVFLQVAGLLSAYLLPAPWPCGGPAAVSGVEGGPGSGSGGGDGKVRATKVKLH